MAIDATTLAVLKAFVKQSSGSSPGEGGQDAREIELQKSDTAIQWRYVGEQEWTDLVQLSEIKGDPGDDGIIPNLAIGTVTTLDAGSSATASIESNPDGSGYVLNLGIPEGEDGSQIADYVNLNNKPSINGIELSGDKSAADYGLKPSDFIVAISEQDGNYTADSNAKIIYNEYEKGATCYVVFNSLLYPLITAFYLPPSDYDSGSSYRCVFGLNSQDGYTNIILIYNGGSDNSIVSVRDYYLYDRYKGKDLIINITNDGETYTADQSIQNIIDAINSGVTCYAVYQGKQFTLQFVSDTSIVFGNVYKLDITIIRGEISDTGDNWYISVSQAIANSRELGGIMADQADTNYTVPAKIGIDNKLYVPTYPTLESLNAQPKDFIVTISGDDENGYTADKTYDEILEAYNAGKNCYANALSSKVPLLVFDSYQINFLLGDLERFQVLNVIINDDNTCDVIVTTSGIASSNSPGIVKAKLKDVETVQVAVDDDGKLWVPESTGGGDTVNVDAELKEYMNVAKPAIASAIINKGGNVESTDSLNDYATRITEIPNNISAAETLPDQTTLIATGLNDSVGIKLNWTDVEASGYLILRKENAKPTTSADGTIVYNGAYASAGYTDTDVQKGKVYYYRIFCRNSKNQYQSTEDGAVAMVDYKDRTGQTLINDLPLGSKIKFGEWDESEFFWEIVDTQDKNSGYVTVAADQNLGNRQFDASETNNPVTNRKNQGNNRWLYSAVRQLLNSSEVAGSWWTAQHEYDVAPSYATQIDGFLKDFTTYEKNIIVSKTNRCNLDTNDGGGSETMIDKVWFPSSYAMGTELFQPLEDDHVYEAYTDNASRAYQSNWWLRTINGTSSASNVRYLYSSGSLYNSTANNNLAVRPFCLLPTSAYMVWSDSDEAYVFADDSQRNPTV